MSSFTPMVVNHNEPGFTALFSVGTLNATFARLKLDGPIPPNEAETHCQDVPLKPEEAPEDIVAQAYEEKNRILEAARQEAATFIAAEVSTAVNNARTAEVANFHHASQQLLTALEGQWQERLAQVERDAAGLVVEIARRILHERFMLDEAAIVPVVREALRQVHGDGPVRVLVAANHEPALRAAQAELAQVLGEQAALEIIVTDEVEPFGCLVQSAETSLDARLDGRLNALQAAADETLDDIAAA